MIFAQSQLKIIKKIIILSAALLSLLIVAINTVNVRTDISFIIPTDTKNKSILPKILNKQNENIIFIQISSIPPLQLIHANHKLSIALKKSKLIKQVLNGKQNLKNIKNNFIFKNRYLLSPNFNPTTDLTTNNIRENLLENKNISQNRFLKNIYLSDPTMIFKKILAKNIKKSTIYPVWISDDKKNSYLIILPHKKSSIDDKIEIINTIKSEVDKLKKQHKNLKLTLSGAGYFAAISKQKIQSKITLLSIFASISIAVIIIIGFGKKMLLLLTFMPVIISALVATLVVNIVFNGIHGITLAFGGVLLGLVLDFVIHLLNLHTDKNHKVAKFWQVIYLSAGSSILGFAILIISPYQLLSQLGLFMLVGIITSLLVLKFFMNKVISDLNLSVIKSHNKKNDGDDFYKFIKPKYIYLLTVTIIIILSWQFFNDRIKFNQQIQNFSIITSEQLQQDEKIRENLGLTDFGKMLIIKANSFQNVLKSINNIKPQLENLVEKNLIDDYKTITKYLPSKDRQRQIQAKIPDESSIDDLIHKSVIGLNLKPSALTGFKKDLLRNKTCKPIGLQELKNSKFFDIIDNLVVTDDKNYYGLVFFKNIKNYPEFKITIKKITSDNVAFIDIKKRIKDNLYSFKISFIQSIIMILLLFSITLLFFFKSIKKTIKALLVILLPVACVVIILSLLSIPINIFHLVGWLLLLSLGLDYILFANLNQHHLSVNYGMKYAMLSTVVTFGWLAVSGLYILTSLAITVSTGIILIYVFSLSLFATVNTKS
ncbi:MAG: hypothetical protein DRQ51_08935 [Gammaproteobacteria bacterium]|nr:MAG: hypothetical protein DRQ51_08935 [Gammaproteobacteria bacterium]